MHAIHRCEHNLLSSLFASINALSLIQPFVYVFDVIQVADEEDTVQTTSTQAGVTDESEEERPACIPSCAVAEHSLLLSKKALEDPLPTPFELPKNFPPIVAAGLQAKTLNGKAMTKFITEIAHAIFRFKNYPTREEKEHVARQCVKAYPFLESPRGTGHVSILIHVHACIYNYSFIHTIDTHPCMYIYSFYTLYITVNVADTRCIVHYAL